MDRVDPVSAQSHDLETYHQIYEQIVYLRNSSTLDQETKSEFLQQLQAEVRQKLKDPKAPPPPPPPKEATTLHRLPTPRRDLPSSPVERRGSRLLQEEMMDVEEQPPIDGAAEALLALAGI